MTAPLGAIFVPYYYYLVKNEFQYISLSLKKFYPKSATTLFLVNQMHHLNENQSGSDHHFDHIVEHTLVASRGPISRLLRIASGIYLVFRISASRKYKVYFIGSHLGGTYIRALILCCFLFRKTVCSVWSNDFQVTTKRTQLAKILSFPLFWPLLLLVWPHCNPTIFKNLFFLVNSTNQKATLVDSGAHPRNVCFVGPMKMPSSLLKYEEIPSFTICLENLYEIFHSDLSLLYYGSILALLEPFSMHYRVYLRPHPREKQSFIDQVLTQSENLCSQRLLIWNEDAFNASSIHIFCQSSLYLKLPPNNIPVLRLANNALGIIPSQYDTVFIDSDFGLYDLGSAAFDISKQSHLPQLYSWISSTIKTLISFPAPFMQDHGSSQPAESLKTFINRLYSS